MKRIKFLLEIVLLGIFFSSLASASLGISPSVVSVNFQPNLVREFSFTVFSDRPEQELELFANGDLSQYVSFDKQSFFGAGSFTATLKLPEKIAIPGSHIIYMGAKEKIDPEIRGAIGVAVVVQIPFEVIVPYPGKYLEMNFKATNANAGEPVNFEMELFNKGKENLDIFPSIEIYSDKTKLETLYLQNRSLKSTESVKLQRELNTTDYSPGRYGAVAIVDYGAILKQEAEFRIGELFVRLINYTQEVPVGGINKFELEVESEWNNLIGGAHAEVVFFEGIGEFSSFKTSPSDLEPWEIKTLEGFFDTSNFSIGTYDVNITLIYYGEDAGKTFTESVQIKFVRGKLNLPWGMIGVIALVVLAIVLLAVFIKKYLMKNAKRK